MSADNIIRIIQKDDEFIVKDCFIENENGDGFPIATSKTLEDAVRIANKYMSENIVEYGLSINLLDKKS